MYQIEKRRYQIRRDFRYFRHGRGRDDMMQDAAANHNDCSVLFYIYIRFALFGF